MLQILRCTIQSQTFTDRLKKSLECIDSQQQCYLGSYLYRVYIITLLKDFPRMNHSLSLQSMLQLTIIGDVLIVGSLANLNPGIPLNTRN